MGFTKRVPLLGFLVGRTNQGSLRAVSNSDPRTGLGFANNSQKRHINLLFKVTYKSNVQSFQVLGEFPNQNTRALAKSNCWNLLAQENIHSSPP